MWWLMYFIGVLLALPLLVLDARRPSLNPPFPGYGLLLSALLWPVVFPVWGVANLCEWLGKIGRPPILTAPETKLSEPMSDCQYCLTPIPARARHCPRCGRRREQSKT
jgi:hypothetical protein